MKLGVLDRALSPDRSDAEAVIERLREFCIGQFSDDPFGEEE